MSASSNPLYPIAFALIALAAVGQAHSTRQSRVQQIAIAFVVAAALRARRPRAQQHRRAQRRRRARCSTPCRSSPCCRRCVVIERGAARAGQQPVAPHRRSRSAGRSSRHSAGCIALAGARVRRRGASADAQDAAPSAATSPAASCSASSSRSLLCSVLIFLIDFVELLRQSGKYGEVPLPDARPHRAAAAAGLRRVS